MYLLPSLQRGLEYLGPHEYAGGVSLGSSAPAEPRQRLVLRPQPLAATPASAVLLVEVYDLLMMYER